MTSTTHGTGPDGKDRAPDDEGATPAGGTGPSEADHHNTDGGVGTEAEAGHDEERFDAG